MHSFVQSDIAEGIVAWVNHDIDERCASIVVEKDANNQIKGNTLNQTSLQESLCYFEYLLRDYLTSKNFLKNISRRRAYLVVLLTPAECF